MAFNINIADFRNTWAYFKEDLRGYLNKAVDKTGDTMQGKLILASSPTEDMEAATKKYVDDLDSASRQYTDNRVENYQQPWTFDEKAPIESLIVDGTSIPGVALSSTTTTNQSETATKGFHMINDGKIYLSLFFDCHSNSGTMFTGTLKVLLNDTVVISKTIPLNSIKNASYQHEEKAPGSSVLNVKKGDVLKLHLEGQYPSLKDVSDRGLGLGGRIFANSGSPYKYNTGVSGIVGGVSYL